MSTRVTQKDLDGVVRTLNKVTKSPEIYADPRKPGEPFKANIGHYHIDSAYGGNKLVRVTSEGGGIETISTGGYVSKRELCAQIHVYMRAWMDCNESKGG